MSSVPRMTFLLGFAALVGCRDPGVDLSEDVASPDMQVALTVNGGADETVVRASALAQLPYSGPLDLAPVEQVLAGGSRAPSVTLSVARTAPWTSSRELYAQATQTRTGTFTCTGARRRRAPRRSP